MIVRFVAPLALVVLAAGAQAETKVYECPPPSPTDYGETFAIDAEANKACFMEGPACSPFFGTLTLSANGAYLSGSGKRVSDGARISLTFSPAGGRAVITKGPVNRSLKSCKQIESAFKLP